MVEQQPIRLDVAPASVRIARHHVADVIADHGGFDGHTDNVVLATSELVTNAIKHANERIELALNIDPAALRVEVLDDNDDHPVQEHPAADTLTGRGLNIVDGVADDWGCRPIDGGGKIVWARFDLPD